MSLTLDPFAAGYIGAIRQSLPVEHRDAPLADETLAQIIEDCACLAPEDHEDQRENGAACWRMRCGEPLQRSIFNRAWPGFPPLTAYVADDGKVYTREAGQ